MATLTHDIELAIDARIAWDVLADFGAVHTRLAPGFVTGCRMAGSAVRELTFFNGATASETLVSRDAGRRRLCYAIVGGKAAHYNAVAQVFDEGPGRSRFVWTVDVLPDAFATHVDEMMGRGAAVMKATLEASTGG